MGGPMILEEDRLILHDLKGVNLKVSFFFGTRKEYLESTKCISYSVCYNSVDIRVDQITYKEPIGELEFYHLSQQLLIDDHILSGEVLSFYCEQTNSCLVAYCIVLLGRDY